MFHPFNVGARKRSGFTIIELLIVMAVIAALLSIALPLGNRIMMRSKETVLKENLYTLRTMINRYAFDKQKAPQSLEDLVADGYLREIPMDPMTKSATSWRLIREDVQSAMNQNEIGLADVRSGSDKMSSEGTPYAEW